MNGLNKNGGSFMFVKKNSIVDKDIKKVIYIFIISLVIIVVSNIISYNFLPDYVSIKSDGSNTIAKEFYVMLAPCISIVSNFINIKLNNRGMVNSMLLNIILPALNLFIIYKAL